MQGPLSFARSVMTHARRVVGVEPEEPLTASEQVQEKVSG